MRLGLPANFLPIRIKRAPVNASRREQTTGSQAIGYTSPAVVDVALDTQCEIFGV